MNPKKELLWVQGSGLFAEFRAKKGRTGDTTPPEPHAHEKRALLEPSRQNKATMLSLRIQSLSGFRVLRFRIEGLGVQGL